MRKRLLVFLISGFLVHSTAFADRVFPSEAKRATLSGHRYPNIKLGSTAYRLSPGAKIFDQHNRSIPPTFLPQSAQVLYQTDIRGDLSMLWVLTPKEQADPKLDRKQKQ
ncbi:MAG: hypothetical protein ACR2FI_04040 [Burkholderiales bacterium]|nr:hypothetical protein [Burkholderiales bacterium]MDQ3196783.1 hypothetical protein [Pseudomonadota bacterium]